MCESETLSLHLRYVSFSSQFRVLNIGLRSGIILNLGFRNVVGELVVILSREFQVIVAKQARASRVNYLVASGEVLVARERVSAVACAAQRQRVPSFIFTAWIQQHSSTSAGPVSTIPSWTVV